MIHLLIADDHPVVREGLKRIIAEYPDMQVIGEAGDGDEALAKSMATNVDVLLLDLSMPGPGFLQTMDRLRTERPGLSVLVLSVHPEDDYAVRALRAGAAGYLTKNRSPKELADAIRRVDQGGKYVSPTLAERLVLELERDAERPLHETLSNREYQVFSGLASGKAIKEIGSELALSPKTVSTYRTRILEKMRFQNNAELVRYAVENALVR